MIKLSKNERKRWADRPFVSGSVTPNPRVCTTRECLTCASCGSVSIVGGQALQQNKKYARFFCDIQCAGEFKKWHNRSQAYLTRWQETRGLSEFGAKAAENSRLESLAKQQRRKAKKQEKLERDKLAWSCCCWCGCAYHNSQGTRCCSFKCMGEKHSLFRALGITTHETHDIVCERCNKTYAAVLANARFCSERCRRKAHKRNYEHKKRSSAFGERISIGKLIKKHKGKCVVCNVKCTESDGLNKDTEATIDHIVPIAKGGLHIQSNVQLMCRRCNYLKNDTLEAGTQLMLALT